MLNLKDKNYKSYQNKFEAPMMPVLLCGGGGSRVWPLSRLHLPKQFLKPPGKKYSMLQSVLMQLKAANLGSPILITNKSFADLTRKHVEAIGIKQYTLLLEEQNLGTSIAIALGVIYLLKNFSKSSIALIMPIDCELQNAELFFCNLHSFASVLNDYLLLFGIPPSDADNNYGFIEKGPKIKKDLYEVSSFLEKPSLSQANMMFQERRYLWNSGMIACSVGLLAYFLKSFIPDAYNAIYDRLIPNVSSEGGDLSCNLPSDALSTLQLQPIESAVLEKVCNQVLVAPIHTKWLDWGNLYAMWKASLKDLNNNFIKGQVFAQDTKDSYLISESNSTVVVGLNDVVVINLDDVTLVSNKSHCNSVAKFYKKEVQGELAGPRIKKKNWGYERNLSSGPDFKIKMLVIYPLQRLSLQMHEGRSEHWVILSGSAKVTKGGKVHCRNAGEHVLIPKGEVHRLENMSCAKNLMIVEVQMGIIDEADILRLEDDYGRATNRKN